MNYKGYTAIIEYDEDARLFRGRIINIKDVINFYGTCPDELEREMKNSVEEYLSFCKEVNKAPEKPFSGKVFLRTSPNNHRIIAEAAAKAHLSINQWAESVLVHAAQY